MVALLDVSVLIALFNGGHADHDLAHDWFSDNRERGWASCAITENGLLRVLGNPHQGPAFVPIHQLSENLRRFCASTPHEFWPEDMSLRERDHFDLEAIHGPQQITDAYLLGLAVKRGARFVTFDQRVPIAAVKGATRASLEVIAAAE